MPRSPSGDWARQVARAVAFLACPSHSGAPKWIEMCASSTPFQSAGRLAWPSERAANEASTTAPMEADPCPSICRAAEILRHGRATTATVIPIGGTAKRREVGPRLNLSRATIERRPAPWSKCDVRVLHTGASVGVTDARVFLRDQLTKTFGNDLELCDRGRGNRRAVHVDDVRAMESWSIGV